MSPSVASTHYTYEKTPKYIEMPPQQIRFVNSMFPSLKAVAVLREPGARAYSWFNMMCRESADKNRRFVEVLNGPYAGQIWRYLSQTNEHLGSYRWKWAPCTPETFQRFLLRRDSPGARLRLISPDNADDVRESVRSGALEPILRGLYASKIRFARAAYVPPVLSLLRLARA